MKWRLVSWASISQCYHSTLIHKRSQFEYQHRKTTLVVILVQNWDTSGPSIWTKKKKKGLKKLFQTILQENSSALPYLALLVTEHNTFKSTISLITTLPSVGPLAAVLDFLAGVLDFQKSAIAGTPFFITLPFVIAFFADSYDKIQKKKIT